ncbi:MAG: hypothetical protein HYZ72_11525 [Deltaproteobacteria bacterium]|nr:hypothetical protein [Deltaproteobacteria bacterium]
MQQHKAKLTTTQKATAGINAKIKRAPRQAQRQASRTKEARDPNAPILNPCSLLGPDGKVRPGWEMWVGDILFGRADTKESLLQYYTRIHEPMPSGHWRERSWQSSSRVARRARHVHDGYEEDTDLDSEMAGGWD